jgi:hypothetical protein
VAGREAWKIRHEQGIRDPSWYVARALGWMRRNWRRGLVALGAAVASTVIAACGSSKQGANEPSGEFPVEVTTAKFPNRQRLAETQDLKLGVKNTGEETIPNLAINIYVDQGADGSFSIRLDQPGLANPNRPVWILENGFPKLKGSSARAGGETAQTNTYAFGPLAPDQEKTIVWRLTPVRGGTYELNYRIAAGLLGKAKAITEDGSTPSGSFVVTISTKPPQTHVTGQGKVVTGKAQPGD